MLDLGKIGGSLRGIPLGNLCAGVCFYGYGACAADFQGLSVKTC
jgi:hypothetical protein